MNELETTLHRTRKTLWQVCHDLGLSEEECKVITLDTCSSCSIWVKKSNLRPDLDGNPICNECFRFYGL